MNDAPRTRRRVLAAGVAGNVLEWYDFALYGYLAPITAAHFFPSSDPMASLVESYAVFALGLLARPLGGLIFGHIGDRFGRRHLLTLSVALIALPTFLMGLLPTYESIGIAAPILLAALRLIQGISAGGEFSGSIIFLVEHARPHRRGLYGSVANFGAMVGGLLGAGCGWLVAASLTPEAMQEWGWRLPFLSGILVGFFGLWMRMGLPEPPAFAELAAAEALERQPIRAALRTQWRPMALSAGLNWVASAGYYIVFVWFVSDMTANGIAYSTSLAIGTLGLIAGLTATLVMGHLSDRVGPRPMLIYGSVVTAALSVPLLALASTGTLLAATLAQFGLALLVAIFLGTLPAVFVSLHDVAMRCTALSLGYNMALAIFGGTAPLVATLLVQGTGWSAAPGLYLALTALVCGGLAFLLPREKRGWPMVQDR
ncbi:MFS transporter [Aquabacter sp. CN5-332]|uniref:MFS transporter n=1 Tax=Aquabacter sp. CN5-332 TaxID=3156608 RepID=UPI0032B442A3